MKQLTSYNRVAGYLNKIFDMLNAEYFECALSRPTITIQSTPRAYGHFTLNDNTWVSTIGGSHEINVGAGTLSRPIENIVATLLHEMVHYYNYVNGIEPPYAERHVRWCERWIGFYLLDYDICVDCKVRIQLKLKSSFTEYARVHANLP